jgi:hypothetical protein
MFLQGYLNALYAEPKFDPTTGGTLLPLSLLPEVPVQREEVGQMGVAAASLRVASGGRPKHVPNWNQVGLFRIGMVAVGLNAGLRLHNFYPDANDELLELLSRHVTGDWGLHDDDNGRRNNAAVRSNRGQVRSEYATASGALLWVFTYFEGVRYTNVVAPEEY